ncbi:MULTISPECIES: M28 family peptidase [unclassified Pedobacter]|uniref:M28 family peptidase n=1 Tax=Pedobacter TaxID=84567 RepID=UPI000B4BC20C|nr:MULTISPECIES: M28 family peptidase [unclassified Pedobacter]MCX2433285.1 M28 family peptidase [Pedobacter sp. GR22-10]MCX2582968.1 M28 family peptidase [Pedobacter sp. MR22-3]OWK69540.1 peptidase [Pedobacter sp. AJM]
MNKRFLTLGLASLLSVSCFAQVKPLVPNKDAIRFSKAINPETAFKHLSVLASDAYEGRETGKKGAWMAADYIRDYFKSIGLKGPVDGSYFQKIDLASYVVSESMFTINGQPKQAYKDYLITSNAVGLNGFTFSADEVVFAGYGISKDGFNEYDGLNIEGKVVMIFGSGDPTLKATDKTDRRAAMMARQKKLNYLAQNKAKAVIVIDPAVDQISPERKAAYEAGQVIMRTEEVVERMKKQNPFTIISISTATANEILKAANTSVDAFQKKTAETTKPASQTINVALSASAMKKGMAVRGENVLGYLEGSDPKLKKEVLVLTGHYDHIGITPEVEGPDKINNGADDDGSGTTGVLLMAKAFTDAKKAGKGPKRSILFMTVVGEEKGLWGSDWYSQHPVFPVENTIADLNTDMIGRIGEEYLGKPDSANYIYSVGSKMLSSDLGKLSEQVNATYTKMKLDYKYDDPQDTQRIYYRSDHYNFAKLGIPIIFYYDGMLEQDYHRPGDEVSKINFTLLTKRAKLTYYTAWELANGAKRPAVDLDGKGNPKK